MLNFIVSEKPEVVIDIVGVHSTSRAIIRDVDALLRRYDSSLKLNEDKPEEMKKISLLIRICRIAKKCSCKSVQVEGVAFYVGNNRYYYSQDKNIPASVKSNKSVLGETIRFEFDTLDMAERFRKRYFEEVKKFNEGKEVE